VKNHYARTYFDEFMPTCLRGAVFLRHSVDQIIHNLDKRSIQSFQTSNLEIIQYCPTFFGLQLPSLLIRNQYEKFLHMIITELVHVL